MYDEKETEDYEIKADMQALDWMISNKIYDKIKNNYKNIEELDVVKSFFVYRLARDKIIKYSDSLYQKYNPLVNI